MQAPSQNELDRRTRISLGGIVSGRARPVRQGRGAERGGLGIRDGVDLGVDDFSLEEAGGAHHQGANHNEAAS